MTAVSILSTWSILACKTRAGLLTLPLFRSNKMNYGTTNLYTRINMTAPERASRSEAEMLQKRSQFSNFLSQSREASKTLNQSPNETFIRFRALAARSLADPRRAPRPCSLTTNRGSAEWRF
jgi:hypothetical protein